MLEEASVPVTRQSWIEANWPEPTEEWSAELELQLPDEDSPPPAPCGPGAGSDTATEPSLIVQHVMESTGLSREEAQEMLGGLA